jgi:hypothetical protein
MSAADLPSDGNSAVKDTAELGSNDVNRPTLACLLGGATRTTTIQFWTIVFFSGWRKI